MSLGHRFRARLGRTENSLCHFLELLCGFRAFVIFVFHISPSDGHCCMPDQHDSDSTASDPVDNPLDAPIKAYIDEQLKKSKGSDEHSQNKSWKRSWRSTSPITKATLCLTASVAFATVAYAIIAACQLSEMRRTNGLTQDALNKANQNSLDSSKQFQAQLSHFDAGLGRTELLAIHAGEQAVSSEKAARAAKSAADTAKNTLTTSQGAYVTMGRKDGVVAEFVTSKDHPDENVPLIVYFQNIGHIQARFAWDTSDRKDGILESFGINRFTTGLGRNTLRPNTLGKNGEFYESSSEVIAGDSVRKKELAYISQSDLEKLSKKIVGFYIDGYYAYCDRLGTWSTHQFTLNYHTDIPNELRWDLISDIEIPNIPIPKSTGSKSYFPPCTSTLMMSQTQKQH